MDDVDYRWETIGITDQGKYEEETELPDDYYPEYLDNPEKEEEED